MKYNPFKANAVAALAPDHRAVSARRILQLGARGEHVFPGFRRGKPRRLEQVLAIKEEVDVPLGDHAISLPPLAVRQRLVAFQYPESP